MYKKCCITDCEEKHSSKGLCNRHYLIVNRAGGFIKKQKFSQFNTSIDIRLLSSIKIDNETSCWNWTRAISQTMPKIRYQGKTQLAYRLSYEVFIGDIPKDMTIDHLCENRSCINPFHLEPVTRSENVKRFWENRRFEKGLTK